MGIRLKARNASGQAQETKRLRESEAAERRRSGPHSPQLWKDATVFTGSRLAASETGQADFRQFEIEAENCNCRLHR